MIMFGEDGEIFPKERRTQRSGRKVENGAKKRG